MKTPVTVMLCNIIRHCFSCEVFDIILVTNTEDAMVTSSGRRDVRREWKEVNENAYVTSFSGLCVLRENHSRLEILSTGASSSCERPMSKTD